MKTKVFLIFFMILFLTGCGNYRELNDMAIVTGVSIDKVDDKYELGFLIANSPKTETTSKEGEAQTTVYTAKGKTISLAASNLDYKSPKKLYLGHINVVIISEEIGKEGFFKVADFLLRHYESRKRFFLMQAKDNKAKEILKTISPLESFPSQSIASLLKSNKEAQSVVETVDYSTFTSRILEKGYDPILPAITLVGSPKKAEKTKNIDSTEPESYLKLDKVAIYKNDKFKGYADFNDGQAVSIVNSNVSEFKTVFKYKKHNIGFTIERLKSKIILRKTDEILVKIKGEGYITEINTKDNLENPKVIKKMEKALNKKMEKNIKETINKMQTIYGADVFGFGNKVYKKYPKVWKKLEKNWNVFYFPLLKIEIDSKIIINSSGSLDKTIKEVKS